MNDQPIALFIAGLIESDPNSKAHHDQAAAELRRMHEALTKAATIAHCGGLFGISEADALVEVRRITLPYWSKELAAIAKVEGV